MPSLLRRVRRRWIVLIVVVVLVALSVRLQDRLIHFSCYQALDRWNLVVATVSGPGAWARVTSVSETPASITIGVSSLIAPLPGTGDDQVYLTVQLRDPFADRTVIDAMTGLPVAPGPLCGPMD